MPEHRPAPARSAADLATRITHQAACLGDVGQHATPGQAPTADGAAQLVLNAEPLRETLAFREDADTSRRETGWELHALAYMLLPNIDLLSTSYPEINEHVDAAIRERQRAKPFSESVAAVLTDWPAEQRARLTAEFVDQGDELPSDMIGALRTDPGA
ncbi:hypothetical protein [Streptomyces sp. NPDC006335]|uniref:hypothetical protein n=1 Tax=Streptomyces sp. NPDC006335 TaxID=3156895 RepID=UPI00339DEEDB